MKLNKICLIALSSLIIVNINAMPVYMDNEMYLEARSGKYVEDRGVLVENEPDLGYLVYRDSVGKERTIKYNELDVVVEKQPYYESYDKMGYIDELFPNFEFDSRDSDMRNIAIGDSIYLRFDTNNNLKYISATSDYIMRYGKIHTLDKNNKLIMIRDDKNRLYTYEYSDDITISKKGKILNINQVREGEYIKLLLKQNILSAGELDEILVEVVVDGDTRIIENLYTGQMLNLDTYKKEINLSNGKRLSDNGLIDTKAVLKLAIEPSSLLAYSRGKQVSVDYIKRYLKQSNVYTATEKFMGKERVAKINFNDTKEKLLPTSEVIYSAPGVVKLRSGESLVVSNDAIVVKDNRLVEPHSILVGDRLQTVITGNNTLSLAKVSTPISTEKLEVFRGRIREIEDNDSFEVETFSLLDENVWYYYPQPRTFTIDKNTKLFKEDGIVDGGIDGFISYGEDSNRNSVYTVIANGDRALSIIDMPYTKESIRGVIYKVEKDMVYLKDVYYYNRKKDTWDLFSNKNIGVSIAVKPNSVIVKNGDLTRIDTLEKGDTLSVMIEDNIKELVEDKDRQVTVDGYLLEVR